MGLVRSCTHTHAEPASKNKQTHPCSIFVRDPSAIVVERETPAQQDIHDHAQCPNVDTHRIRFPLQHLRSEVSLVSNNNTK